MQFVSVIYLAAIVRRMKVRVKQWWWTCARCGERRSCVWVRPSKCAVGGKLDRKKKIKAETFLYEAFSIFDLWKKNWSLEIRAFFLIWIFDDHVRKIWSLNFSHFLHRNLWHSISQISIRRIDLFFTVKIFDRISKFWISIKWPFLTCRTLDRLKHIRIIWILNVKCTAPEHAQPQHSLCN